MNANYLLFMPSVMQDNRAPIEYTADNSKLIFHAAQTNIPATEYIIANLAARGEKLNKLIMLCSDEVLQKEIVCDDMQTLMTTYDYYVREISDWMSKYGYTEEEIKNAFFHIKLQDANPGSYRGTDDIRIAIQQQIVGEGKPHLFLDYTGGLRNASMMLLMFARLLEIGGLFIEDVLYSNIIRGKDGKISGRIESCMETYSLFYYLDAYSASVAGDLEPMRQFALAHGDEEFAQEIGRTKDSKNQARYRKVKEEELPVSDKMDITKQLAAQSINKARSKLSHFNQLKAAVANEDIHEATRIVREFGLQILADTGYLKWTYHPNGKSHEEAKQNDVLGGDANAPFFAYTLYYRTYLKFVASMLSHLQDKDESELMRAAKNYYWDNQQLTAASKDFQNGNQYLMHDFINFCANCQKNTAAQKFEIPLLRDIRNHLQSAATSAEELPDEAIRGTEEYRQKSSKYQATYLSTGFPFGNVYWTGSSYSSYSRCGREFYGTNYYKLGLMPSMENLCKLPEAERQAIINDALPWAKKNTIGGALMLPKTLTESFPPVQMQDLFLLRDGDYTHFGHKLILMDRIRKMRNLYEHDGHAINDQLAAETTDLVRQFIAWVDTLTSDTEQTV